MKPEEYRLVVAKAMTEEALQEHVRQAAEVYGWMYYHTYNSRRSPEGFPDCVLLRGERLIFAELKRWDKNPTPAQVIWIEALGKVAATEVYVWRPQEQLDGTINNILYGRKI